MAIEDELDGDELSEVGDAVMERKRKRPRAG
jgi:hypothetical protein